MTILARDLYNLRAGCPAVDVKHLPDELSSAFPLIQQALDFERSTQHTLLVAVVNEVPFAIPLLTATTTVVVTVVDVNEAPIFNPIEKQVSKREDLAVGSEVVQYTASDPDTARKQIVT